MQDCQDATKCSKWTQTLFEMWILIRKARIHMSLNLSQSFGLIVYTTKIISNFWINQIVCKQLCNWVPLRVIMHFSEYLSVFWCPCGRRLISWLLRRYDEIDLEIKAITRRRLVDKNRPERRPCDMNRQINKTSNSIRHSILARPNSKLMSTYTFNCLTLCQIFIHTVETYKRKRIK